MTDCEFDHVHARALGGGDELDNYRPLCPSCHKTKTFGKGGEKRITTAGSDIGRIAKLNRLEKQAEENRRKMLAKETGAPPERKSRWPKRKMATKSNGRNF